MKTTKMDEDIKDIAKRLIISNEKRKKRMKQQRASEFDKRVAGAVADALNSSCNNIASLEAREQMRKNIYQSIVYATPYEYIGEAYCGRRQFYDYRNEFILGVAVNMGMIPGQKKRKAAAAEGKE